ncbi:MAG TPA: hypothetical protein VD994_05765 [Prosthecobacter sp.]|nr:hypothetical protein [Prosthecobacter sp.]
MPPKSGEPTAQLYRIDTDLAETQNLVAKEPEIAKHLDEKLRALQATSQTRP